ncbi:MAG: outer membrane protein assembly factor BamA [Acidobacteria bacterium]|nr:outer membrane protein assembly factor BamA [Acidobacteriota bacterium]MBI3655574.1 outer membrane protein assembly factor BamA [Acidobacteriota bacterium]
MPIQNGLLVRTLPWRKRRFLVIALILFGQIATAGGGVEDFDGKRIAQVIVRVDGRDESRDLAMLQELLLVRQGALYSNEAVRSSIYRLFSTRQLADVQVEAREDKDRNVEVIFNLERRRLVKDVKFVGQSKLKTRRLQEALLFKPGDPFDEKSLTLSEARLRQAYQRRGYTQAEVKSEWYTDKDTAEVFVRFYLRAGPRARLRRFDVIGDLSALSAADRARLIVSRAGAPYSEIDLVEDVERLRAFYLAKGYFSADIRLIENQYLPAQQGFVAVIRMDPGPYTEIAVEGFPVPAKAIRELLPLYEARSLEAVYLDEGRSNLKRYVQSQGYYFAQVEYTGLSPNPISAQRLVYFIVPGEKRSLATVHVTGNQHMDSASLLKLVEIHADRRFSRSGYSSETLERSKNRLTDYYHSKGFLNARVKETRFAPAGQRQVKLILDVEEGPLFLTRSLKLFTQSASLLPALRGQLTLRIGEPFSYGRIADDQNIVLATLAGLGYQEARFEARVQFDSEHGAAATYEINEGERFDIDSVVLLGNRRTRAATIARHLSLQSGEPFSLEKALAGEQALYDTGLFKKAEIRTSPSYHELNRVNVFADVEEAKPYVLAYGFGYQEVDRVRGLLEITNNNVWGTERSISARLRSGFREQRAQLVYDQRWVFDKDLPLRASLFAERTQRFGFKSQSVTGLLQTEYKQTAFTSWFFRYSYKNIRLFDLTIPLERIRRQDRPVNLGTFSAAFLRDRRDDLLDATKGVYTSLDVSYSPSELGSSVHFAKVFGQQQYFRPLGRGWVWAGSARIGVIKAFTQSGLAPISERFFAGGGNSLRGFPLDRAGPLDPSSTRTNVLPLGGNALVIGNVEVRVPVNRRVAMAPFYDTGNVFPWIHSIKPRGFSNAVGLGLRVKTPIGPMRLDMGFNFRRATVLPARQIHFSVGPQF